MNGLEWIEFIGALGFWVVVAGIFWTIAEWISCVLSKNKEKP